MGGRLKVLVVGGSGFVGGAAVRRLRELGCAVATFHRGEGAEIRGDRRDLGAHRKAFERFGPDAVLDTIAYAERDAAALVATLRRVARRLVVLSSQDVYASYGRLMGLETGPREPAASDEDAPLRTSRFPYRAVARDPTDMAQDYEKILVEQVARAESQLPATILRLPCVYGPGDRHHRVGQVLARLQGSAPFLLDRKKGAWRWTRGYVENVADAIALATMDPRASGRTYNVGEAEALSEAEWAREIFRAAGWSGELLEVAREELPAELVEPYDFSHDLVADTSRIRRELGYRERVGLEEALAASVGWERAHSGEGPPAS